MEYYLIEQKRFVGIPLFAGDEVVDFALVSFEDAERILKITNKWRINSHGYAYCRKGNDPHRKLFLMHRVVLNASEEEVVDHINRKRLDNRRVNLRIATHAQNLLNHPPVGDKTSGFIGVQRQGAGFIARIGVQGKRVYLGRYPTAHEAAKAYDLAAIEHHGGFAPLNFPQ